MCFFFGVQKARLSRLHQSKLAARRAIAEGTRRFDEWQRRTETNTADVTTLSDRRVAMATRPTMNFSVGQPLDKKDLFELQHFHLIRCLEHTTVLYWLSRIIANSAHPRRSSIINRRKYGPRSRVSEQANKSVLPVILSTKAFPWMKAARVNYTRSYSFRSVNFRPSQLPIPNCRRYDAWL